LTEPRKRQGRILRIMDMPPNNREFTRVPAKVKVEIATREGVFFTEHTRNISMNGLYLECEHRLPPGTECRLRVFLGEDRNAACIGMLGQVSRVDDAGMAVEFKQIEVEGFEHLRNLVLMNTTQVQQVEEEFRSHVGIRKPQ
jgi:hypothetical protein